MAQMKSWGTPKIPVQFTGELIGTAQRISNKTKKAYTVAKFTTTESKDLIEIPVFRVVSNAEPGTTGKCRVTTLTDPEDNSQTYEVEFLEQ